MSPDALKKPKEQITVAHFMPWSGIGGVEIATLRLVAATRDRFHHIAFCLADAFDLRQSFENLGIPVVTCIAPEPSIRHAPRFYKESRAITRMLKQLRVDLVHFSDVKAAQHNSLAALLAGLQTICHVRVSYPQLDLRTRLCLKPVDLFLFVSREAMDTFDLHLPEKKKRVLYDAVEPPSFDTAEGAREVRRELGIPPEVSIVGMVARVSRQKDYFTLARAAVEVLKKSPATRFLIVGDNSNVELNRLHYEEVLQKLESLGIADSFLFTGHRSDVSRLTSAMDVCVLCTHREGFPLSIIETMAMAKPVIATSVGGIPEVIQHGVTGYLHQHENSGELATAITLLLEDPAHAKAVGLAGREHVRSNHSPDKFIREVSAVYDELTGRHSQL